MRGKEPDPFRHAPSVESWVWRCTMEGTPPTEKAKEGHTVSPSKATAPHAMEETPIREQKAGFQVMVPAPFRRGAVLSQTPHGHKAERGLPLSLTVYVS